MAQTFDKDLALADVYAAALFDLAAADQAVDAVRAELEALVRLQADDPRFAAFLASAAIDDDERERSLERMFRGRLSDRVLNTLQVMNRHGRVALLPALLRAFVVRTEHARGQIEVTAISAAELDARQKAEIEALAGKLSGKTPLVQYVVDADILGGLILQIGGVRYDNSLRHHLQAARARLLERTVAGAAPAGA